MSETREARLERALEQVKVVAAEAYREWDQDNDSRVGKLLAALAGSLPKYRVDIDAVHAALSTPPEAPPEPPTPERERPAAPAAWIEHHKGGDNLVWDDPGGDSTPLYRGAERPSARCVWQPIETAPKDRWILLWGAGWREWGKPDTVPVLALWSSFSHCFVTHDAEVRKPTHWCDYVPVPLTVEAPHA